MSNYRKKPVVIQAHQWFKNGDHPDDGNETFADGEYAGEKYEGRVVRYFRRPDVPGTRQCSACGETFHVHGWIDTLEGGHIVCPGDWIITGVAGERYPCKPRIFAATYEPADAPVPAAVPALQRFNDCDGNSEPDPIERMRCFLSLALSPKDWVDVEPFLDALVVPAAVPDDVMRYSVRTAIVERGPISMTNGEADKMTAVVMDALCGDAS